MCDYEHLFHMITFRLAEEEEGAGLRQEREKERRPGQCDVCSLWVCVSHHERLFDQLSTFACVLAVVSSSVRGIKRRRILNTREESGLPHRNYKRQRKRVES